MDVFFSADDRQKCLDLLSQSVSKHALDFVAWCLMSNSSKALGQAFYYGQSLTFSAKWLHGKAFTADRAWKPKDRKRFSAVATTGLIWKGWADIGT
jgi:hypothetical protein